jgi:hypothetical protein
LTSPDACGPFGSNGSGPWYLNIWNTGTTNLSGLSYIISVTGGGNPKVSVDACSVAWFTGSGGSCAGTATSVLSKVPAGTYPLTVGIPVTPGSEVYLRATSIGNPTGIQIATSVCSGGSGCTNGTTARQIGVSTATNG